jgi:hypothetical protein
MVIYTLESVIVIHSSAIAQNDRSWQKRPFLALTTITALEHRVTGQSGPSRLPIELVPIHNLWTFSALQRSLRMTICSIDLNRTQKTGSQENDRNGRFIVPKRCQWQQKHAIGSALAALATMLSELCIIHDWKW